MKVFLQSIFGQLILTPYIFWRGYQALPAKKSWRIPYVLFFVLELLVFFTGYFFWKQLPDAVWLVILYFCNTWYIASVYITMCLLFLDFLQITNRIRPWFPEKLKKNWAKVKLSLFFVVVFSITGLMIKAYHNTAYPTVQHVHLTVEKGSSDRDSVKIAFMSDTHIGEMIGKKMVERYVSLTNAEKPDVILIGGDVIDYETRWAEKDSIENLFRQFQAPLGVYIIYGNHEYRANRHAKYRWFQRTGATLLLDSVVSPDNSFYIVGREDLTNKKRKPLQTLLEGVDTSKPVIVLDHQPNSFSEMVMNDIDLGLHGHTHYGQIWPYPWLMHFIYENPYGHYKKSNTQFYVSSGIGFAGPPYRVGTKSELVILHVRFE